MVVLKFGGTSVEDAPAIERVCEIVASRAKSEPAVVVVSALARVTDQLDQIGTLASGGDVAAAASLAREWAVRHLSVARGLLPRPQAARFAREIAAEVRTLTEIVRGVAAVHELSPRTQDRLLAFGERVSSQLVAAALAARGTKAEVIDAREVIITDQHHTRAIPDFNVTNARLQARVKPLAQSGVVPVLGGFIGSTPDGATTTLGRGGSDFTASIVGAALGADRIEIWTDVDGIMTTDPKLCAAAQTVPAVTFDEAAELAHFGAKVIHPWSLVPARERGIPVHVLNSRNPRHPGTVIRDDTHEAGFKGIAVKHGANVVEVVAERKLRRGGFLKAVFDALDRHGCVADVVATTDSSVSVSTANKAGIPGVVADLSKIARVRHENSKAVVSLVGENPSHGVIPSRVLHALADVPVRLAAQGASRLTLSFVVDERDVQSTVERLHAAVFEPKSKEAVA